MEISDSGFWKQTEPNEILESHNDARLADFLCHFFSSLAIERTVNPCLKHTGTLSVGDFGCGDGYYVRRINEAAILRREIGRRKLNCIGYDGRYISRNFRNHERLSDQSLIPIFAADLTETMEVLPCFDWGLCIEVMEHIPPHLEFRAIRNLFARNGACPKNAIISWAKRGQPGIGHVNCRDEEEVVTLFTSILEFKHDEQLTKSLREAATVPWLKENLLAFVNPE